MLQNHLLQHFRGGTTVSALQVVCILYVGLQLLLPGQDAGIDFAREYELAKGMSPDRCSAQRLLGLELSLQLLHPRAVLPLAPARAAVQLDASGKLVAALSAGWQQMEQVTPQMGEAQGALQLLLLNAGQALQLS